MKQSLETNVFVLPDPGHAVNNKFPLNLTASICSEVKFLYGINYNSNNLTKLSLKCFLYSIILLEKSFSAFIQSNALTPIKDIL